MVKRFQSIDEYYESDDEDIYFYPPDYYETDEQFCLVACLIILKQYFDKMKSMTPTEVLDEVNDLMGELESELLNTSINQIDSTVWDSFMAELIEYNIPIMGYVEQDTSMYDIVREDITLLINQLKGELRVKSLFSKDNMSKGDFDITPNFKRAIQKLNDTVGNNLLYSKEKSHRKILKFVYGEDTLYKWYTMNDDRVCDWCRQQEKKAPKPIDEWGLDHPKGRCGLEPVDNTYSDEYYMILSEL